MEAIYISSVFIAGLLSFFSPCILPVLPVYLGFFGEEKSKTLSYPILKAIFFVTGLSTSFILLGFGAGALGKILYGKWFLVVCGIVVIILGIHQTGFIQLPFLNRDKRVHLDRTKKSDMLGSYLLGFTFSFGWTPCVGPVLATVLGIAATKGSILYGGFLMMFYSLGLVIPFLIMAVFSDYLLSRIKPLYKHMKKIKIIGGILIILMGILLMSGKVTSITAWLL